MTKHLRLIMLSLFAMICMGGYSAVGDTYKLVTSGAELNDGDVIVIGASQQGYAMGPVNSISSNNRLGKKVDIVDGVLKFADGVAELTLKACADNKWQFLSNEGYLCAAGTASKGNYLRSDGKITDASSIATIVFEGSNATITFGGAAKSKIIRYNHSVNKKTQEITSLFSCYSSGQKDIQIYKKQGSGLTSTSTTFGTDYDGKAFEFVNGVLKGWKTPTATHTPADVTGKIKYTSDNVSVADVDQDGQLTFSGYGTATITATFTPDETKTYVASSASYTVINKDPYTVDVVFVASVDKGKTTVTGKDEMSKNGVSIQSENAALGNGENYRFYQEIKVGHTFSVKRGFITKIVFEGGTSRYSLENVTLKDKKNGAIITSSENKAIWKGEAKSVVFTTSGQARATKITVTVKVPVAKDYTLNETATDNTIEAYENANVTLTRTFYKDGEWNTLCLPFAVADAKTAFDNAELREVDTKNSHDNTIVFKEATAIEAGKPYLIKWANLSSDAVNVEKKFEGVTLVAAATPVEVNNGGISFNGFYKMTEASELGASVAAIGAGNKLFKVTEGKMKGFRAAFVLSSGAEATGYRVVIDGTATGIEDLVIDGVKANGRVYNLNGQYVGNSLNGLQPGLYIQNGKKIVVK